MKTKKIFFIALVLYFVGNAAFAQTEQHKTYDYIILLADSERPTELWVTINAEKHETIKMEKRKEWYDYTEIIKYIKQYEKEGYEVFQSNLSMDQYTSRSRIYFLLRREHKE